MAEDAIKLLLQARASRTWYKGKFTEAQAQVDLILIQISGVIMSERTLSKKWQWSRKAVHRFQLAEKGNHLGNHKGNHPKPVKSKGYKEKGTTKDTSQDTTEKSVKPEKKKYKDCVFLTDDQKYKLTEKFGYKGTEERIIVLNDYKMSHGKKYDSDYHALLVFERNELKKRPKAEAAPIPRNPKRDLKEEAQARDETQRRLGQLADGMREL